MLRKVTTTPPADRPDDPTHTLAEGLLDGLKAMLSVDFPEHDERLIKCLKSSIGVVGDWTGQTLAPAVAEVRLMDITVNNRIPVAPINEVLSATLDGVVVTDLSNYADGYVRNLPAGQLLTLRVETGYETLPEPLAEAVRLVAAERFDGQKRNWKTECRAYRTVTWAT